MAPEKPLISIICAVRNDAKFIRETLESVINQTYPHWELIVMDGASTDKTLDILNEYATKYKQITVVSESDKGQWHGLEKALALARGEYLFQLCGQDGFLDNDWFKRCIEVFEEHPDVSLVWGIPFNMSEDGKLLGPHYAYARFLKDDRYKTNTMPISTIVSKVGWRGPSTILRILGLIRKLTPRRIAMVFRSFLKQDIPQKEKWFHYWLKTGRAFPEQNMCVRKDVYVKNTTRFPKETMTNSALLDFTFNFNTRGYLAYGLPLAGNFSRMHIEGQGLRKFDTELTESYNKKVVDFRNKFKNQKIMRFVDHNNKTVLETKI
ncbi:glycosyltransferase [Patescibacteria group bacterium]|nr:glycosyltransferase [Patescibacteria group bacterium]